MTQEAAVLASTSLAECDPVPVRLPPDFAWFASECRAAGVAFLEGVAAGWGKRELAEWLSGPYGVLAVQREEASGAPSSRTGAVLESTLADLMQRARTSVIRSLVDLGAGEWDSVTEAIRAGGVEPARTRGELVWLPVDRVRMRLEARVLSLFLVDYLFDPEAYEADFGWCTSCDDLWFDGACPRCGSEDAKPSYVRELSATHEPKHRRVV